MKPNTSKFLLLFLYLLLISNILQSQTEENLIKYSDIDSLHKTYHGKYSEEAYVMHHKLLREATHLSYTKGICNTYHSLMWYHGNAKNKSLDSVLHYAHLFESKSTLENSKQQAKIDSSTLAKFYMNKGQLLSDRFNLMEPGLAAYLKAGPLIPKNNIKLLISHDNNLASVYSIEFQYDKALEILLPRLQDTVNLDEISKIKLLRGISYIYMRQGIQEKSHAINQEILALSKRINDPDNILWTKNQITYDYYLAGDCQKAIDSALAIRTHCIKTGYTQSLLNNTSNLSTYYHAIKKFDKAIAYQKEILELTPSITKKWYVYNNLARHYAKNQKYPLSIHFHNKKDSLAKKIQSTERSYLTKYIDFNNKLLQETRKNQQLSFDVQLLEEKNKKQKLYLSSFSFALTSIILLMGTIFLFKKYRKGEKEIEVLKINEKKLLEEKIMLRENELEASAIALSQRLETLNTIKDELAKIRKPNVDKLKEVKKKVRDLIKSASNISIITDRIESDYPTITKELKTRHPNLSDTEIRYCLLAKLNLSIKETATILNVTPGTVKVARSRLKKKIGIPTDVPFNVFLSQLNQ